MPIADFSTQFVSSPPPMTVQFTDRSDGIVDSWFWEFGDGDTSTEQHPVHIYRESGKYTPRLTVTGPDGVNSITKGSLTVLEGPPAPVEPPLADFTTSGLITPPPMTVQFNDISDGEIDSWFWAFDDGGTSTQQHPVHVYQSSGQFFPTLTVTGPGGSHSVTKSITVPAAPPPVEPPVASFFFDVSIGEAPLTVNFQDRSDGVIDAWAWAFGDGATSTEQNPSHTYTAPGRFTVTMTVTGPGGSDSAEFIISVFEPPPVEPPVADFAVDFDPSPPPMTVAFINQSTGEIDSFLWDFGDGATSSAPDPTHTYQTTGDFTARLTASGPGGEDTVAMVITVPTEPPPIDPPVAEFRADISSGPAPLTVRFTDVSIGEIDSWQWDFGDGAIATVQHPVHVYQQPGDFTVALTVTGPGGQDQAELTITALAPGEPPGEGMNLTPWLVGGAAALAVGVVVAQASRRRR